jgi:exo-1,4-beta-D-glucosaminidase
VPTIPVLVALALLARAPLAPAEGVFSPTQVDGKPGSAIPIAHWQIQSSAKAQQSGAEVSSAGFSTEGR